MAEDGGTLERIVEELADALTRLSDIAQPANLAMLLNELGIDNPPDLSGDAQLAQKLSDVVTHATELTPRVEELILAAEEGGTVEVVKAGAAALAQCDAVGTALDAVGARLQTALASAPGGPQLAADLARRVIGDVIARYLDAERPLLRRVLTLATVLEWDVVIPETDDSDAVIRRRLHVDRLPKLLSDPLGLLESGYGWGRNDFDASRLLQRISELFEPLDPIAAFGDVDGPPVPPVLDFWAFTIAPAATTPPGLDGELFLDVAENAVFTLAQLSDEWRVVLGLGGEFREGFKTHLAPPTSIEFDSPPNGTLKGNTTLEVVGQAADPDHPLFLLGIAGASRIEAKSVSVGVEASGSWSPGVQRADGDVGIRAIITGGRILVLPGGGDGFLAAVLPRNGMQLDFDLVVRWSSARGLHIEGGAGLEITIPVNRPLGPILLDSVNVGGSVESSALALTAGITALVELGPLKALVKDVGLRLAVDFASRGNLGPVDLNIDFKPPSAVGLSVDAQGITGGGFLQIDPPNYAGVLELSFQNQIDLTAFGLITTRLPDGRPGFSLVISILAEFQPIQLGLGFALTGVGGLIAINRQFNQEALQLAFKNHSLDAILFPQNPIKDAVKLIESIQSILPPREGYHVFGPMAKLFWGGSRRLVNFEIGIFIQIGGPLKIVLIGQAWSRLPTEDSPQLVINVDVLGIIDFGEQRVAIDATLFDSHILDIRLDGQMALRADWSKGEENFALSVGGFHPQFQQIPPGFPQLRRLAMVIGDNPRLSLTMYLAITTNTLQVGAKLELWADKLGFTITGGASFDALFTFIPFSFLVNIKVWVSVKRGGIDLGLWLELELSGPNPIIASGYVKIKLGGLFSFNVKFRAEFGIKIAEPLPAVSPLGVLKAELQNPRAIRPQMPAWASANMTFAETGESKIDPIADLIIVQSAVPLNFDLEKFGGGVPPAAERRLKVTTGSVAGERAAQSLFAPEQFKNWTAEERLSAKPFEKFDAGIGFGGEYVIPAEHQKEREIVFETILRESQEYLAGLPEKDYRKAKIRTACLWQPQAPEAELFNNWSRFGAGRYYRPRRPAKDDSNPNYVKVAEFNR